MSRVSCHWEYSVPGKRSEKMKNVLIKVLGLYIRRIALKFRLVLIAISYESSSYKSNDRFVIP